MILALLCVAQFVVVLDATIVAVALPAMQADLGLSTTALGWVITAYTLTFGGCLLAAGRLADRTGRRRAFTAGLVLFALASLACGLAPSGGALLAARAVQGLGAALVAPAALALLTATRPDGPSPSPRARDGGPRRPPAAERAVGSSAALLSGLLDWRWVFLVNVPVCALGAVAALRVLPEQRVPSPARADLAGAALATTALAALVFALTSAEARGPAAAVTLGALAAAIALFAAFARVEARADDPLLDGAVLRRGVMEPEPRRGRAHRRHHAADVPLHALRAGRARAPPGHGRAAVPALQPRRDRGLVRRPARGGRDRGAPRDGRRADRGGRRRPRAARDRARRRRRPVAGRRLRAARRGPGRRVRRLHRARHGGARRRGPGPRLGSADARARRSGPRSASRSSCRWRRPAPPRSAAGPRRRSRATSSGFAVAAATALAAAVVVGLRAWQRAPRAAACDAP